MNNESDAVKNVMPEKSFFRYSGSNITENATLQSGLASTQYYWSLSNPAVVSFLNQMENRDNIAVSRFFNLDERTVLNTLASVRYYVVPQNSVSKTCVPYGFERVWQADENQAVFENRNSLPLGYAYEFALSLEEFEKMDAAEKEKAMLNGVVLEKIPEGMPCINDLGKIKRMEYEQECVDCIKNNDDKYIVTENEEKTPMLRFYFEGMERCETYLCISGMNYEKLPEKEKSKAQNVDVTAYGKDGSRVTKSFRYATKDAIYNTGRESFVINMGYWESPLQKIELSLPKIGMYSFDSIEITCNPLSDYEDAVNKLKENVLENVELHNDNPAYATNHITGEITLDEERFLVLTIPYSKGWTAYVDGEKTELVQANLMFMGIRLEEGSHHLRLEYRTPGARTGIVVTMMMVLMLLLAKIHANRKKGRQQ